MLSVYVVCWIFLQTFQTYFCIQANSVDPDQTAPKRIPHCLQKWLLKSQADDKADDDSCDWRFKDLTLCMLGSFACFLSSVDLLLTLKAPVTIIVVCFNCFLSVT